MQTLLALLLTALNVNAAPTTLGHYQIDPHAVTVSGVSSGAFMAVQMEIAYSATFSGAASLAGGIFWCAQGDATRAQTACMKQPQEINPSDYIQQARQWATDRRIDSLENIRTHRIYLYASPKDEIVNPTATTKLNEFYKLLGAPTYLVDSVPSAHGWPTVDKGNACNQGFLPWILKCEYDAAKDLLTTMYGALTEMTEAKDSHIVQFSQAEFNAGGKADLYDYGWLYVPQACMSGELCKLHIALHGCQMNPDYIQNNFVTMSGLNPWAESNHVIVLYPQAARVPKTNPYGCWDWFGVTGADYATQSGPQMAALKQMIDRLTGAKVQAKGHRQEKKHGPQPH